MASITIGLQQRVSAEARKKLSWLDNKKRLWKLHVSPFVFFTMEPLKVPNTISNLLRLFAQPPEFDYGLLIKKRLSRMIWHLLI